MCDLWAVNLDAAEVADRSQPLNEIAYQSLPNGTAGVGVSAFAESHAGRRKATRT